VFWPVGGNDFINYDDQLYLTENPHLQQELSLQSVRWAFTTFYAANWHPVTWLSHMMDVRLFGMNPAGPHWINLALHLANVLIVFTVFNQMTSALWPSIFVAVLFAIHPLHVESVAWASERKDLLSALFGLLAIWIYAAYSKRGSALAPIAVFLLFALSLLSKPMLVTLPFLLLLLDYWPLERIKSRSFASLVCGKLPLFLLSIGSAVITYLAQQSEGAVKTLGQFSIGTRIQNALTSYVVYLMKTLWPRNLAPFYPHPGSGIPIWQVGGAAILLLGISYYVVRRKHPYLLVGWLWYLGMLVPVIGIIQVGDQALADRYTYLPLVGIFIMLAWSIADISARWKNRPLLLGGLAGILIAALGLLARTQVGYWKNSVTLFQHAVKVTDRNSVAHYLLGDALDAWGQTEQAKSHYLDALSIDPTCSLAHNNLGTALLAEGNLEQAEEHFLEATRYKPHFVEAHTNLGAILIRQGKLQEATGELAKATEINPDYAEAYFNLGIALAQQGRRDEAAAKYAEAIRLYSSYPEALRVNSAYADACTALGVLLAQSGRTHEAVSYLLEAIRSKPNQADAHYNLALAYLDLGRREEAGREFEAAERIRKQLELPR
jgi:Flp pilus assembly protein TadD